MRGTAPDVEVDLLLASAHGPWQRFGVVHTDGEAPHAREVRFNPGHRAGGIVPAGPFQSWREQSYPASHVAPDEV